MSPSRTEPEYVSEAANWTAWRGDADGHAVTLLSLFSLFCPLHWPQDADKERTGAASALATMGFRQPFRFAPNGATTSVIEAGR